jgi:hypothetical protein
MKCGICKQEIEIKGNWDLGNNAQPVCNGRCCDVCNFNIVLPQRLIRYKEVSE